MSRYTSLPPERNDTPAFEQPKLCEIPGCSTLLVPRTPPEKPLHKQGKADVLVKDHTGNTRGICCQHYHEIANEAGVLPNQHLVGRDGAYDRAKVLAHWEAGAQTSLPIPATRRPTTAKGLDAVLDQLAIPKPAHEIAPASDLGLPPEWGDRPW